MNMPIPEAKDVWKWITGAILVIALAFMTPSIGWFIDSRDRVQQPQVDYIQERQVQVLIRLSAIDTQIKALQDQQTSLETLMQQIQEELRSHELNLQNQAQPSNQ